MHPKEDKKMSESGKILESLIVECDQEQELMESLVKDTIAERLFSLYKWELDIKTGIISCSENTRKIFGLLAGIERTSLDTLYERIPEEQTILVQEAIRSLINSNTPLDIEFDIRIPEKQERSYHTKGELVRDKHGKPCKVFFASQEITKINSSDKELLERIGALEKIFEYCMEPMLITRIEDGLVLKTNSAAEKLYDLSKASSIGNTVADLDVWPDPSQRENIVKLLSRDGIVVNEEAQFRKADGRIIDCLVSARLIEFQGEKAILSNVRDVTDRKRCDEELVRREQELRRIIENLPDPLYRADMDGNVTFISPAVKDLAGYHPDEVIGRKAADYYIDPACRTKFLNALYKGDFVKDFEAQMRHKDGGVFWVSTSARLLKDDYGNPVAVEG
jgi:PAS domain S-box-containing protein